MASYTKDKIAFVMGILNLTTLFDDTYYEEFNGELLVRLVHF